MSSKPKTLHEVTSAAGKASAAALTPEQRSERSRRAVNIRWARVRRFREDLAAINAELDPSGAVE